MQVVLKTEKFSVMMFRWLIILLAFPLLGYASPGKVKFFQGNLSSAKVKAGEEGKLYFAEFSASWCAPCRLLEETTFSDPTIISYIDQNYIPVRIDIDAFDGIALKQVYNVQTIPTIIIFNSKGKLLEKYDKALPASTMLNLLKKHNTPANRIKVISTNSASSPSARSQNNYYNASTTNRPVANQPVLKESHSPMRTPANTTVSRPDKQPVIPVRVEENISISPAKAEKPMPQGDGLYRFTVSRQVSQGFSVQIGAFKEYGNVLREVERIQKLFDQHIIVHILNNGDQPIYKILVGEFTSRQQAIDYRESIKKQGLEGVIKDLSMMK